MVDRVALLAHLVDLVAGAVARRVGHGMAAVAVGLHLQDVRALAGAAMGHRLGARRQHLEDVHAVDLAAGDVVGLAALVEIGAGRGARDRGAHAVLVVLDDEHDRQLPQRRHVEGLHHLALVGGAVTVIGQRYRIVTAVVVGKAEAGADRHAGADDAVAAVEVLRAREHVHRAALALGVAALAPGELGHHPLGVHAAGQHVAVVAVGGHHRVDLFEVGLHAHHHGLLADVEVAEAGDLALAVELARLLLETADQQHVAVELEQLRLALLGPGRGRFRLGGFRFGGLGGLLWDGGRRI